MPKFIVDTCSDVVDGQKKYLSQFFKDVWALNGYEVVVGGSKMRREIFAKEGLLRLITDLSKAGRVANLDNEKIDARESEIKQKILERVGNIPKECDDTHIFALALLSECKNVITQEKRMSKCIGLIRAKVGHDHCPQLRLIRSESTYVALKKKNKL